MTYIINTLSIIAVTIFSLLLSFINFFIYTDNNVNIIGFLLSIVLLISVFIIWIILYRFINSNPVIKNHDRIMFHLCFGFYLMIEIFYTYSILNSFIMLIEKANPYDIFKDYFLLVSSNRLLFFIMLVIFYIYIRISKKR